jgi:hypothetical protein
VQRQFGLEFLWAIRARPFVTASRTIWVSHLLIGRILTSD